MATIDTRLETEKEFLALILNKNEIIDLLQIQPHWLTYDANKKMLKYIIDEYKQNKVVIPSEIYEKHPEIDINYLLELYTEVYWDASNWKKQLDLLQQNIFKSHKEDYIKKISEDFKKQKINFNDFVAEVKRVEDIKILDDTCELKKQEIVNCLNEKQSRIEFNNFRKLNNTLKMVQGDFLIIGATTGAGKSGLMLNLMNDLMGRYQCIYFNMEMSKSTIYKRLVAIKSRIKVNDIENPSEYQKQIIDNSLNEIENSRLIIEHKASNMSMIRSTIAKMKDLNRHTIIFIDHLGLVKIEGLRSLYEQATEVAKELRQICLEYDCTIISASQLNRGAYSAEDITLSMLKDSGELENSASKVVLLYKHKDAQKDDLQQKMIFDVAKNRDGYTGTIDAIYDKEKQIFEEI